MGDYHTPTVVEPVIPLEAMTPLEYLVLGLVFDAEDRDGTYLHSWCGPSDVVTVRLEDLRQALQASCGEIRSVIGAHVGTLIAGLDAQAEAEVQPDDDIDLDLSQPQIGWDHILQGIVRRSPTLDEIVVWTAFTCNSMRIDGFGGTVTRITAGAIQYETTKGMLAAMRTDTVPASGTDSPALT